MEVILKEFDQQSILTQENGSVNDSVNDQLRRPGSMVSTVTTVTYRSILNFDHPSLKCFKEIQLSNSSVFDHPLHFFPEFDEDPGICQAYHYEEIPFEDNVGRGKYIEKCKILNIAPYKRVLNSLDQDELDLRYYGLRSKEACTIFQALAPNRCVKRLILQDNVMDNEALQCLSDMLIENQTITELNLKQCELGPEGAQKIRKGLDMNAGVTDLDLSFNSLGDSGIIALKQALKENQFIRKLNLGHNELTSKCANALQQFLSSNRVVEDLNLEWNILCDDEDNFRKIIIGLMSNKQIASLNLSWNALESIQAAKFLSKYLKETRYLEFLDLSNNGFTGRAARILKKGITANTSLRHLKLGNNPLTPDDAEIFASILMKSETLEILDLENVYFYSYFKSKMRKIQASGRTLIIGGILGDYKIKGPNVKEVLLKRCNYLGLAPKKKKAKRDFAQIVLTLPEAPMDKKDFEHFVQKKKKAKMYDSDLLSELQNRFPSGKNKIDTQALLAEYKKFYPDIELIKPKEKSKKDKKGKKKGKVGKIKSETTTTTESESESEPGTRPTSEPTLTFSSSNTDGRSTSKSDQEVKKISSKLQEPEKSETPSEFEISKSKVRINENVEKY